MAEPYDTIDALTPTAWWRFGATAAPTPDEGTGNSSTQNRQLTETSTGQGGVLAAFNWTYQYEANPLGDGYGMLANGGGGLFTSRDAFNDGTTADFTMLAHYRSTVGTDNGTANYMAGTFKTYLAPPTYTTTATAYTRIYLDGGELGFSTQYNDATFKTWETSGTGSIDLWDQQPHTICVVNPTGTSGTLPTMYIDGVLQTVTLTASGSSIGDNYGPAMNYPNHNTGIGYNGANSPPNEIDEIVFYDVIYFQEHLTQQEVENVHVALGGTASASSNFQPKTIRRRGRRLFFDYSAESY
jgi:hypothetical protein